MSCVLRASITYASGLRKSARSFRGLGRIRLKPARYRGDSQLRAGCMNDGAQRNRARRTVLLSGLRSSGPSNSLIIDQKIQSAGQ